MKALLYAAIGLALLGIATGACEKKPRLQAKSQPEGSVLKGGTLVFQEEFSKDLSLWETRSKNWRIVDGRLYTGDASNNNEGLWLKSPELPPNVRIEFDATSVKGNNPVFEGDIKCEFGGPKREHVSGYVALFGGWKNSLSAICKGDEHGQGQLVKDSQLKVEEGKTYHFAIIRMNSDISWYLDGKLFLNIQDKAVLTGGAFGFNNWNSRVYFDNLKIFSL